MTANNDMKLFNSYIRSTDFCTKLIKTVAQAEPAAVERLYGRQVGVSKLLFSDHSRSLAGWIFGLSGYALSFNYITQNPKVKWKDLLIKAVELNLPENRKSFIIYTLFTLHIEQWKKAGTRSDIRDKVYKKIVHLVLDSMVRSPTKTDVEDKIFKGRLRIIEWLNKSKERIAWINARPEYVQKTLITVIEFFQKQLGISTTAEKQIVDFEKILKGGFAKFGQLAGARLSLEDIKSHTEETPSLFFQACQNGCTLLVKSWVERFGIDPFITEQKFKKELIYLSFCSQNIYLLKQLHEKEVITANLLKKQDTSGQSICNDLIRNNLNITVEFCIESIGIEPFVSTESLRKMLIENAINWKSIYILQQLAYAKKITLVEIIKDHDIEESLFDKVANDRLIEVIECWVEVYGIEAFLKDECLLQHILVIAIEGESAILLQKLFKEKKVEVDVLLRTMEKDPCFMEQCIKNGYKTAVEIIIESYGIEPFIMDDNMKCLLVDKAKVWDSEYIQSKLSTYHESKIWEELETGLSRIRL